MQRADERSGADSDDSPFRDAPSRPGQRRPSPPEHLPSRPSWDCATDGEPWPCREARDGLAAEYAENATGLAVLMWDTLEQYALDAGQGPLSAAYERFMGWSRGRVG